MKSALLVFFLCGLAIFVYGQQRRKPTLRPSAQVFPGKDERDFQRVDRVNPVVLPDGRIVVTVGDSVYMLGPEGKQLWKYAIADGETVWSEPAYNPRLKEIAIVAPDLIFIRLDAETGKEKWHADSNGRASFVQVVAYGKGYLVRKDMSGYRENDKASGLPLEDDLLGYWGQSEDDSWTINFPRNSDVVVSGTRIYAARRTRNRLTLRKVQVPENVSVGSK